MPPERSTLGDFGVDMNYLPLLERKVVVETPVERNIAGFVCKELHNDGIAPAYSTLRGKKHYYQKGEGWAISDRILSHLAEVGVERIYVHVGTEQDDPVFEFRASDYFHHGENVPEEDLDYSEDPQTFVPLQAYNRKYDAHAAYLFKHPFEDALGKMGDRRWQP